MLTWNEFRKQNAHLGVSKLKVAWADYKASQAVAPVVPEVAVVVAAPPKPALPEVMSFSIVNGDWQVVVRKPSGTSATFTGPRHLDVKTAALAWLQE